MMMASHFDLAEAMLSKLETFVALAAFCVFVIAVFVRPRGCIAVCAITYRGV